jgi:MFS family permease
VTRAIVPHLRSYGECQIIVTPFDKHDKLFRSYQVREVCFMFLPNILTALSSGGHMADKIGRLNLIYPMTILSRVSCLPCGFQHASITASSPFPVFYGFCSGVFVSAMLTAVGQITPVAENLGARLGAFSTAVAVLV